MNLSTHTGSITHPLGYSLIYKYWSLHRWTKQPITQSVYCPQRIFNIQAYVNLGSDAICFTKMLCCVSFGHQIRNHRYFHCYVGSCHNRRTIAHFRRSDRSRWARHVVIGVKVPGSGVFHWFNSYSSTDWIDYDLVSISCTTSPEAEAPLLSRYRAEGNYNNGTRQGRRRFVSITGEVSKGDGQIDRLVEWYDSSTFLHVFIQVRLELSFGAVVFIANH